MSPAHRGMIIFATVAAAVALPDTAYSAQPEERPIRVEYSAHEGCPDVLGFFWYVRARTQRVRLAAEGETADLARISIVRDDDRSLGTLELAPFEGRPFSREVEAPTCGDVVLALSLVVALAYDPDATTTFPSTVTAPPAPAPAPTPPAPPPVVAPAQTPESPLAETRPRASRYGGAAGIAVLGSGGISPNLQFVLAPFVEFGANARTGLWRPRARASFLVEVPAATVFTSVGAATLQLFAGQIEGCPISVPIAGGVAVVPCLGLDAGKILGNASSAVPRGQSGSLWWIAVEGNAHLHSELTGPLFAEVTGGGGVTTAPGKFVFVRSTSQPELVFDMPALFGSFGLALGAHFP